VREGKVSTGRAMFEVQKYKVHQNAPFYKTKFVKFFTRECFPGPRDGSRRLCSGDGRAATVSVGFDLG